VYEQLAPVLSLAVSVASVVGFIWAIKSSVGILDARLTAQDKVIEAIQRDLQTLNKVVIDLAVQSQRMNAIEDRSIAQGKRLDEAVTRVHKFIDKEFDK
jgi:hypothetical protein